MYAKKKTKKRQTPYKYGMQKKKREEKEQKRKKKRKKIRKKIREKKREKKTKQKKRKRQDRKEKKRKTKKKHVAKKIKQKSKKLGSGGETKKRGGKKGGKTKRKAKNKNKNNGKTKKAKNNAWRCMYIVFTFALCRKRRKKKIARQKPCSFVVVAVSQKSAQQKPLRMCPEQNLARFYYSNIGSTRPRELNKIKANEQEPLWPAAISPPPLKKHITTRPS